MSRLRYLNPCLIRSVARDLRSVAGGGGPKRLRLVAVGEPRGLLVPTSTVTLEVEARDGTTTRLTPELPVAWPYAWSWRLARLLRVPLVSSVEPEDLSFSVGVPGRG
jgi:hypothetical protein